MLEFLEKAVALERPYVIPEEGHLRLLLNEANRTLMVSEWNRFRTDGRIGNYQNLYRILVRVEKKLGFVGQKSFVDRETVIMPAIANVVGRVMAVTQP